MWETFGARAREVILLDPLREDAAAFVAVLHRFDGLVYQPRGLVLPRWGLFDCAMVPGLVCGLARRAAELGPNVRQTLQLDGEDWVPISSYIALPMLDGAWLGHSLACLSELIPGETDRRRQTLELALELLRPAALVGTSQWNSTKLPILTSFAPLEVLSAWIEAHDQPGTLVYRFSPGQRVVAGTEFVDLGDVDALIALQDRIEGGESIVIAAPPMEAEGRRWMPIARGRGQ